MRCPKCNSENCHYIDKTHVKSSAGKACCGYALCGPLGVLCGLNAKTVSEQYWVCNDCGKRFNVGENGIAIAAPTNAEEAKNKENDKKLQALDSNTKVGFNDVFEQTTSNFVTRAYLFIEEKNLVKAKEYIEKELDVNAKNPYAHFADFMCNNGIFSEDDLSNHQTRLEEYLEFNKAQRYADEKLLVLLNSYIQMVDKSIADEEERQRLLEIKRQEELAEKKRQREEAIGKIKENLNVAKDVSIEKSKQAGKVVGTGLNKAADASSKGAKNFYEYYQKNPKNVLIGGGVVIGVIVLIIIIKMMM